MIKILQAGLYSTVQDLGRFGYRDMGIPVSGAMDKYAMQFSNHLLGNNPNDAVIEMTMMGSKIEFEVPTNIAVTGANFTPLLNGKIHPCYEKIKVQAGDILSFQPPSSGLYGYIAFEGGIKTEEVFGSRSFYAGITKNVKLEKGQILPITSINNSGSFASINYKPEYLEEEIVEVSEGPEWNKLSREIQSKLQESKFSKKPSSNRMATILEHKLDMSAKEIITGPVQPGTVQLTPSGNLIALMRDAQTTGGYSRVLQLTKKGQNVLAQVKPGSSIKFKIAENT